MTDDQELSMEERISRNDAVRALTQQLKTETEERLQLSHEDIQNRKLDEDHVVAQAELAQEVRRAVSSGTVSEAKAAMILAAAGIDPNPPEPVELPLPAPLPVEAPKPVQSMATLGAPASGEEK